MAGDIFFTDSSAWSTSSVSFVDIMMRAVKNCRTDEDALIQILSTAEKIQCLGINLQHSRSTKIALTERVLEAARDKLQELRADSATHPRDVRIVEELVAAAQEHLSELGGPNRVESQL
jgi:hypothetical protein